MTGSHRDDSDRLALPADQLATMSEAELERRFPRPKPDKVKLLGALPTGEGSAIELSPEAAAEFESIVDEAGRLASED